jgi:hypothetical protein
MKWDLGDGSPALTRFFISYSGTAPTNSDLDTFCTAVSTAYGTNLKSLADTGGGLKEVDASDLSSATGAIGVWTGSIAGTRGSTFIGAGTSLIESYKIARRYRGGHPRGYWPFGIQTDMLDRNTWKGTFTAACDTGFAAFFTAVLAAGWTGAGTLLHTNVSYYQGFTVVTNPITGRARNVPSLRGTPVVDTVTSLFTQGQIGSQRRRDRN